MSNHPNNSALKTTSSKKTILQRVLLPAIISAIALVLVWVIFDNPPESNRGKPSKAPQMTVAIQTLTPQPYQVMVQSFGTVQPRTQSVLFAQVSGQINQVSSEFRDGGFFEKGDVLMQLDDRDHRAEVNIAQASFMAAQQNLQEEGARVRQAQADWERLGNGKDASALVLRQPQFEAAKAQVLSAEAQLNKAKLSLERTKIVAPYAGRILKKHVDIGQVISSNTQLADIYAVDYVEIRLPIKNKDLPLMKLPEEYRDSHQNQNNETVVSNVVITSTLLGKQTWQGKVVRTESAIDELSQQLYVVAQIISPYDSETNNAAKNQGAQIKIGQYVTAEITGRVLADSLVIPSSAIYQGSYVYTVENGLLMRKEVSIRWQNGTESIIAAGLVAGDALVLTPLGQVSSGTPVAIEGAASKDQANKNPKTGERKNRNKDGNPKKDRSSANNDNARKAKVKQS
ncbi:efflux RND transporter periplasmic adaptor subunit [Colwellia sp. D2M02]|uniref:efflux RND transporter periplasmic adaptor subunit n=1 Tax=Colwellia sp. D2M02 TaxID=2841562 RepID=UPI001C0A2F56|nr:efflux RND transporter periplasmic adaptor subunit [Colwellia sp. D2M02]MBU2893334.1 efflux RND transporter periplasmic adaptor subunit [Colwellia sp. D2M02]